MHTEKILQIIIFHHQIPCYRCFYHFLSLLSFYLDLGCQSSIKFDFILVYKFFHQIRLHSSFQHSGTGDDW